MAYLDIYTAATDEAHVLRKQVAVALHQQALVVLAESAETPYHSLRVAFAEKVLKDPVTWAGVAIWRILANGTVAGNPTGAGDALVLSVMANAWDVLSKING